MGVFSAHEPDSSIIEFSHPLDPPPNYRVGDNIIEELLSNRAC